MLIPGVPVSQGRWRYLRELGFHAWHYVCRSRRDSSRRGWSRIPVLNRCRRQPQSAEICIKLLTYGLVLLRLCLSLCFEVQFCYVAEYLAETVQSGDCFGEGAVWLQRSDELFQSL